MDVAGSADPQEFRGRATTPIQGRSLLPVLKGQQREPHEWLYFQFGNNRAIRQGDWKAVSARGGRWELYDLGQDRTEMHDQASRQPKRLRELTELWHDVAQNTDQAPQQLRTRVGKALQTFPADRITSRLAGPAAP